METCVCIIEYGYISGQFFELYEGSDSNLDLTSVRFLFEYIYYIDFTICMTFVLQRM